MKSSDLKPESIGTIGLVKAYELSRNIDRDILRLKGLKRLVDRRIKELTRCGKTT